MNTPNQPFKKDAGERPQENKTAPKGEDGIDSAGNVDQIRDILFGSQMRDYEKKFGRVEERLARESTELREEIKRRFASLESFIKNEITALADQLKAEKSERVEADKDIVSELKDNLKIAEKRAQQIEEQAAKSMRDLRQQILEESKRLTEDMEQKHKEAAANLEKEGQALRDSLTDRMALGDLFGEVALRLKNEFKMPAKK